MGPDDWIRPSGGRILVAVKVVPGSARSAVAGLRDGALLVRVAAPPERGKANEELRACLAAALDLPKSQVELAAGHASRRKSVSLPSETEGPLRALAAAARP